MWLPEGMAVRALGCMVVLLWRGRYCDTTLGEAAEEVMASCP